MDKIIKREKTTKITWEKIWQKEYDNRNNLFIRINRKIFGKFNSTSFLYNIYLKETKKIINSKKRIISLETGFGKGNAALLIAKKHSNVLQILMDISPSAIKLGREKFSFYIFKKRVKIIKGSIFNIPLKEESVDILWNEGVLEHFNKREQILALKEFSRVLKKNGKILIIVPNNNSLIYKKAMNFAVKNKIWEFGYEKPISSLKEIVKNVNNLILEKEYSVGFISQFGFLRYFLYKKRLLKNIFLLLFSFIQMVFFPLNRFPGYYLVCIIRKK